jgi:uncharacterized membrane protein YfcA
MSSAVVWVPLVGLVIGLTLGALGGGGSILTVPALVYLLGQGVPAATTGSLVIVGVSSLVAAARHRAAGHVRVTAGVTFGALGVIGAYAGTRLSSHVAPHVLLTAFALLIVLVATLMIRRDRAARAASLVRLNAPTDDTASLDATADHPSPPTRPSRLARLVLAATGVGLLTGFFGVGGGFAIVPALVLVLGYSMPVAVGTSLLVISLNSASALTIRAASGALADIDWLVIGSFTLVAALGSLLGARVAQRVDPRLLTRSFVGLLLATAAYLLVVNIPLVLAS